MQEGHERIKRRRLNVDGDDDLAHGGLLHADATNADLTSYLLRNRILAAEQQQQQQNDALAMQERMAFANEQSRNRILAAEQQQQQQNDALAMQERMALANEQSLLGVSGGDPMFTHLRRQNFFNQQLQQRLGGVVDDPLSYLRASEAAAPSSSIYASLLGGRSGGHSSVLGGECGPDPSLLAARARADSAMMGLGGRESAFLGGNPAMLLGAGGADASLLAARARVDPMLAARGGADPSFLGARGRMDASMLGARGAAAAGLPSRSQLLEQALGGGDASGAASSSTRADQMSHRSRRGSAGTVGGPDQLRASYMHSLFEAERESEAAAAAAAGDEAGSIRHLLNLPPDNGALFARIQHERSMAAAAAAGMGPPRMGGPAGFSPAVLHSMISRGGPGGGAFGRDLFMARGPSGVHHSNNYLGMNVPGVAGHPAWNMPEDNKYPPPAMAGPPPAVAGANSTGRQPIHLYMSCDDDDLSPYQCLVRKQIELFEAEDIDAETNARGRNRPIVVRQVGIRCRHCKTLPPRKRERAAIYYPSKLDRLYQAGQTMASVHLGQHCNHIPEHLRKELARLREGKSAALAGKKYWSDGARALGVVEDDERLFFGPVR